MYSDKKTKVRIRTFPWALKRYDGFEEGGGRRTRRRVREEGELARVRHRIRLLVREGVVGALAILLERFFITRTLSNYMFHCLVGGSKSP